MPASYTRIVLHTVFSTKYRRPFIHPSIEARLFRFIRSRLAKNGCYIHNINGGFDHLHLLHSLPRVLPLAKLMEDVKSLSSKWIKGQGPAFESFAWQDGYASFSVDYRQIGSIMKYIDRQKQHHYGDDYSTVVAQTFEDEFQQLLVEYECDFDLQYLFPRPNLE